ncbi:MAG TPA: cellulase family glycosylhydrolase [Nitrososphaera sp.]|nr:cellulase family glycosylhydrolase [Nitrososphaera sp.]
MPHSSYAATTDCSDIPVKNFKGVVFVDGTLGKSEHDGKASVLTSYVTESMKYIRLSGFNAVRVPYYWEAYVNDPTSFMAELQLIAQEAKDNNICVIFDNHHFYTSSYWDLDVAGKSDGRGFPSFVVKNFPERNNDYIDTAGPFWGAFWNNGFSINGQKVWDVQWSFLSKVINKVDGYSSVAGYEILNEPHLFKKEQYDKLGDYNTFMAKKIRSISDKKIFFDRETTRGFQREPSLELHIFPDGVSGTVYAPHLYSVPKPGSQGEKQIKNIKTWSTQRNTEVLIGEWGAETQSDAVTFMKAFKANGFGWTAHSWKKSGSGGLGSTLYDSDTTSPTSALKVLMAALDVVY